MNTEQYVKLTVLGAILIAALMYPIVSALILTAVAAWHLQELRLCETALVQKAVDLTPPGIKMILGCS